MQSFYVANTHVVYVRNRDVCVLHAQNLYLCFLHTQNLYLRVLHTQKLYYLTKLGATKCAPAGAFFPPKTHLLFSINRESVFLCLRDIQAQLLGSKVAFRVHETLVWNTPADPHNPPEVV